jgi:parvulin-like peptidyl-prolyl isomerase
VKKILILGFIAVFAAAGCSSKKAPATKLASGSAAYDLAKDLMKTFPGLDPDKSVATVTSKHFDVTSADAVKFLLDQYGTSATTQLKTLDAATLKNALERGALQLGERKLLLEAATEAKSTASPEEVKAALDSQFAQAGGEAQFAEMLKGRGLDLEFVKASIAEDAKIQKYLQGFLEAAAKVTEAEVKAAYAADKTATVRHILLLTKDKTPAEIAEIRKKMDGILARAKKGEDFAALAKEFTEDPGSKETGGLYEDFSRGRMVKPFEDAAFSVPVGQISGIIETEYGFHVLKVEGRKKETQAFDDVKAQLESQLKERKQAAAFESHLTGLKDKANFKVRGL